MRCPQSVQSAVGVHKNTVSLWLKAWRSAGEDALKAKRRGRRPDEQKLLSAVQERHLRRLQRTPDKVRAFFQTPTTAYAA